MRPISASDNVKGLAAQLSWRSRLLRRLYRYSRLGNLDHVANYGGDGSELTPPKLRPTGPKSSMHRIP